MSDLISQIVRQQKAEVESAYKSGHPDLAAQIQQQNDAANMQMLSNMSQMRYQSMMAVAKNFKY
jgi:vacuolar-type H+-ATPase subunit B/Vma2